MRPASSMLRRRSGESRLRRDRRHGNLSSVPAALNPQHADQGLLL